MSRPRGGMYQRRYLAVPIRNAPVGLRRTPNTPEAQAGQETPGEARTGRSRAGDLVNEMLDSGE